MLIDVVKQALKGNSGVLLTSVTYTHEFEMTITKILAIPAITALVVAAATAYSFPMFCVLATLTAFEQMSSDTTTYATTTSSSGVQQHTIQIDKYGTNSYALSGGSSSVGSFDTTKRAAGERSPTRSAENLIITVVTDLPP